MQPTEDYFAIDRLSNSALTAFWRELNNLPSFFAKESTLEFGRQLHAAIYEPKVFTLDAIKEWPGADRAKFARMLISARNSHVLNFFVNHPSAVFEQATLFDLYGVPFKMKADVTIPPRKSGHDAKSTSCPDLDSFVATFDDYGYWRQAEIYRLGAGLTKFFFTGISKVGQHNTFTVDVSKHADKMRAAKKEVRDLVHLYKETKLKK